VRWRHQNISENQPTYRYGFNGMERDDEIKGIGNSYDFGARLYDPRLGRWFSEDAFKILSPGYTVYGFAGCNPIYFVDSDGNKFVPAPDLNCEEEENYYAALEVMKAENLDLYNKLENLRYHSQYGYISSEDEYGKDVYDEAIEIIIELDVSDLDSKSRNDEKNAYMASKTQSSSTLAGQDSYTEMGLLETPGVKLRVRTESINGEVYPALVTIDLEAEYGLRSVTPTTIGQANDITLLNPIYIPVEGASVHFRILVDDFIKDGKIINIARTIAHEGGHVEGYIDNDKAASSAFYETGGRANKGQHVGHESQNKSGQNANKQEKSF
jgi:RHS repeat-associated protein